VHPPLTALSRDIPGYGAQAARTLLAALGVEPGARVGEVGESIQAETARLVPRGSTSPPGRPSAGPTKAARRRRPAPSSARTTS